jgi:hypothetical protein
MASIYVASCRTVGGVLTLLLHRDHVKIRSEPQLSVQTLWAQAVEAVLSGSWQFDRPWPGCCSRCHDYARMTGNPSLTGKGRVADHSPGIPPESRGTRNLARNASQLADSRPTVQWGADSTWSVQSTTGKFRCCCSSRKRGVERRLSKYCEMRANGVPEFSQIILPEWALQARSSQSRESAT